MANNEVVGDPYVFYTQKWLNDTYGNDSRFNTVTENGKTGWATIYALTRALQIELGIQSTADNFGNGTQKAFKTQYPNGVQQQSSDDKTKKNIYGIIQGALLCKGYAIGANTPTCNFYGGTGGAIKKLKADAGLTDTSSTVTLNIMKALLSMDYFYSYDTSTRTQNIISMQRYLNRNYEAYIGIRPCDGVYSRRTSQALIYAIQAEECMPTSVANGNCGPSTKRCLPTLSVTGSSSGTSYKGQAYSTASLNKFKTLANIALYFNGFGSGELTSNLDENTITSFQTKYSILATGKIDYTTWLSLLISCGDTDRSASACDCATILTPAKAKTLYDNGYLRVGRYLSGYIASGASKALTKKELQIAADAGLYIFPIHQSSANKVSYFTTENAVKDVDSAFEHANALGMPSDTSIYFAVDCDPLDTEITSNIIPYFTTINNIMKSKYNNKYPVSIYGTRNVCTRVSNKGLAKYSFVSDMSTGFSGNLGFPIPDNWAFDQFATVTVGSGEGKIEIDKDAMSGRDLGLIGDLYLKDYGKVYYNLVDMYNLALDYTNNNEEKSNLLVLQYLRKGRYGDTSIFCGDSLSGDASIIKWEIVAGTIDKGYCNLVDSKLYNLNFDFVDSSVNPTTSHDLPHLAATLNSLLYQIGNDDLRGFDELVDCYSGWAGDTISYADSIQKAVKDGLTTDYVKWAKDNICTPNEAHFNLQDYIDDIDAYNLYHMIKFKGYTLPEAFYFYYVLPSLETHKYEYEKRASRFLNYMSTSHFIDLCELINSDETPIKQLKGTLSKAEQKYIDAAIDAFKSFIFKEYVEGR